MSWKSEVGNSAVYQAEEQREKEHHAGEHHKGERYHEGNKNKDQRSLANKLDDEERRDHDHKKDPQTEALKHDPTLAAKLHGNKPSRGAVIDAEIQAEEEAELEKKHRKS
ncbi:MAG: hypothetical protein M1832_003596 [Thelocarpon impressellum]|nr:MAG: hypothetical protein M1832_003596 [Thelocarpon impressellum]